MASLLLSTFYMDSIHSLDLLVKNFFHIVLSKELLYLLRSHAIRELLDLCHEVVHLLLMPQVDGGAGEDLVLEHLDLGHLAIDPLAVFPDLLDLLEVLLEGALGILLHGDELVPLLHVGGLLHSGQTVTRHRVCLGFQSR